MNQECLKQWVQLVFARSVGSCMKMSNKRNRSNFIKIYGFIKKLEELIFVVVEIILTFFKNFCLGELFMWYHMKYLLLAVGQVVCSQLDFTINLEEKFYFCNKKCRIYAAFGVS